jgi:hypothetical protein
MMKLFIIQFAVCLSAITAMGQATYKGLPLIKANSTLADYRVDQDWIKGNWTISPQIEFDSLLITCYTDVQEFAFYTDRDSIAFKLMPGQVHQFFVSVYDSAYARTVVKGVKPSNTVLKFDTISKNNIFHFTYEQNNGNAFLNELRSKYPLDSLIKGANNDTEKAQRILHWVHNQWPYDGSNAAQKNDAISILEEARLGNKFRCVEYGIVATACLNAVGLRSRTLGLMTKNVENTESGAGHVLLEVYLDDIKKWVLLDGQWDVMPVLHNVPLNAVEFQAAIALHYDELELRTLSGVSKRNYIEWINRYLYYFNISFDNREGENKDRKKIDDKTHLLLLPTEAKKPTVFQIKYPIDYCLYTNSIHDFYAAP